MKHDRSQHFFGVRAVAARAAFRFTVRRNASSRHDAWRPVALFWRQQRKGLERMRASRVALAAGAVWFPQFHLHFMIRVNERPCRGSMFRSLPDAAIYPRRVVMDYQRTTVKSSMIVAQPRRDQIPVNVFSIRSTRSGLGTRAQATAPYASSARQPVIPPAKTWVTERTQSYGAVSSRPNARRDSGTSVQSEAPHPSVARQPIAPPTATWAAERTRYPNLGQTHSRVRMRLGTDVQEQTLQTLRTSKREPLVFRPVSRVTNNAVPPYSQESTAPQLNFYPHEMVWRRAVPPAAGSVDNERQAGSHELSRQSSGHSFPGQEVTSGMPHPSERASALPALKIDSALMDRLADDVIRRVERRERIERARRGL